MALPFFVDPGGAGPKLYLAPVAVGDALVPDLSEVPDRLKMLDLVRSLRAIRVRAGTQSLNDIHSMFS